MSNGGISQELQRFLSEHIHSVAQLETLLFLHQHPTEWWSAVAVSQALYSVPEFAAKNLQALVASGLAAVTEGSDPVYRYAPATSLLDQLVQDLAVAYKVRRVTVITLIYSKDSQSIHAFADAFKIKKEK